MKAIPKKESNTLSQDFAQSSVHFSDNRHETKRLNEPLLFLTIDPHEQFFSFHIWIYVLSLHSHWKSPMRLHEPQPSMSETIHLQDPFIYNDEPL